jgi:hypothetical protein
MTLMELVLTLALTAVIVTLLGLAIHLHLRVLDVRRTNVEQAQLARAVLQIMANDIRGALQIDPLDLSSVEQLMSSYDLDTDDLDVEGTEGVEDSLEDINLDDEEASSSENIAGSAGTSLVPGLYGNRYELQVDVSHLPRPDQYALSLPDEAGSPTDVPSDVKSVAYFLHSDVSSEAPAAQSGIGFATDAPPSRPDAETRGLVRRAQSRAITEWASENGNLDTLRRNTQILAPEVNHLEFRYFDGTQWLEAWDTEQEGGLPVAVEIGVWIASPDEPDARARPRTVAGIQDAADTVGRTTVARVEGAVDAFGQLYRLIVDLPVGQPTTDEDEADAASVEEVAP